MGQPAARQNDNVVGVDIHIVMIPAPPGPEVPTPLPHPYAGKIVSGCSTDVKIGGQPAAVVGAATKNDVNHIPMGPRFQKQPNNQGKIKMGSMTVKINGKNAARMGDPVETCNDPAPLPSCAIMKGEPKVLIG